MLESGSLLLRISPLRSPLPQNRSTHAQVGSVAPSQKQNHRHAPLHLLFRVSRWMIAAVPTFQGCTIAAVTYVLLRMEEPLTSGTRMNGRQTTGQGAARQTTQADVGLGSRGMSHPRDAKSEGPPLCALKAATGGTSGPATATCIQLYLRIPHFLQTVLTTSCLCV